MDDKLLRERISLRLEQIQLKRRLARAAMIGFAAASVGVLGALDGGSAEDAASVEDAADTCADGECHAVPLYGVEGPGRGCGGLF